MRCDCGHTPVKTDITTGYGTDARGKTLCFECCASGDLGRMLKDGNSRRLPLYLVGSRVSNWPGTLEFNAATQKRGRHNMAGTRTDIWFIGPDRYWWHGVQYGENTQVVHCKRTKERIN